MAERPILSQYLDRRAIGTWIAQRMHIWQMDFLDAGKLASYCDARGVKFWEKHILQLWSTGLLQADIVVTDKRFNGPGFKHMGQDDYGRYLYADERVLEPLTEGWQQAIANAPAVPKHIKPHFHPFRYYVLFHLQRVIKMNIAPMQTLVAPNRYHNLLDIEFREFDRWSRLDDSARVLQYWNDTSLLAMITEPCVYERIFRTFRRPVQITQEQQRVRIAEHWEDVHRLYASIGVQQLGSV